LNTVVPSHLPFHQFMSLLKTACISGLGGLVVTPVSWMASASAQYQTSQPRMRAV